MPRASEASQEVEEVLVWGDKDILAKLGEIMGWKPSISWFRRWSGPDHPNRLPVRSLKNSRLRCASVEDLKKWKQENVK